MKQFIETKAISLRDIKLSMCLPPYIHYRMDDPRRNAPIPSVVVAASRLFAANAVDLHQQMQQLRVAGDDD